VDCEASLRGDLPISFEWRYAVASSTCLSYQLTFSPWMEWIGLDDWT
jgi:hypothetical protein